jgi:hypothetical protein
LISDEFGYETSCIGNIVFLAFYEYVEHKKMKPSCHLGIHFSINVTR